MPSCMVVGVGGVLMSEVVGGVPTCVGIPVGTDAPLRTVTKPGANGLQSGGDPKCGDRAAEWCGMGSPRGLGSFC